VNSSIQPVKRDLQVGLFSEKKEKKRPLGKPQAAVMRRPLGKPQAAKITKAAW